MHAFKIEYKIDTLFISQSAPRGGGAVITDKGVSSVDSTKMGTCTRTAGKKCKMSPNVPKMQFFLNISEMFVRKRWKYTNSKLYIFS